MSGRDVQEIINPNSNYKIIFEKRSVLHTNAHTNKKRKEKGKRKKER
jgi:hypothetical protein